MSLPTDSWIRGTGIDSRSQLKDEARQAKIGLHDAMILGTEAMRLMRGLASHEECVDVVAGLICECESEVQDMSRRLIAMDDPGSDEAKALHFKMRVNAAIIGKFNRMIAKGRSAAQTLNEGQNHE